MKKIVYIHQYFKTPKEGGALRSFFISKELAEKGHHVDVITSHNKSKYQLETIAGGIRVHYLPIRYSNDLAYGQRYMSFFKFVLAAIRFSSKLQKPDFVYATSTPLSIGLISIWLKWTRDIPYIFEVRDLWPDAPIQLGIIKSSLLKLLFLKLEQIIYKNANKIIALSPGIEDGILKKCKSNNIRMIPNVSDIDFFQRKEAIAHSTIGLTIGYFGAFGLANNLEYILDAALESQREMLRVKFILVGEGARKKDLEQMVRRQGLDNINILPHQNRFEIQESMMEVDACFTSFANFPILETNSPNKFFDGLAAGKLSIVNTEGWLQELVEENQCGFYTDPSKPEHFPKLIKPFLNDPTLLKNWQRNALELAKRRFSKKELVNELCDFIVE